VPTVPAERVPAGAHRPLAQLARVAVARTSMPGRQLQGDQDFKRLSEMGLALKTEQVLGLRICLLDALFAIGSQDGNGGEIYEGLVDVHDRNAAGGLASDPRDRAFP
jgi:hypothetical protein